MVIDDGAGVGIRVAHGVVAALVLEELGGASHRRPGIATTTAPPAHHGHGAKEECPSFHLAT